MAVLRVIDEAGHASEVTPDALSIGFRERGRYDFYGPDEGAFYVDDAPVAVAIRDGRPVWRWEPGFYAGEVLAELLDRSGRRVAQYRLDVAPDDGKLGREVFVGMLNQLQSFDARLLFGGEEAQTEVGARGDVASPLLAYARLRHYAERLTTAFQAVAATPLTRLARERNLVPHNRVRRLDVASVRTMLRRPDTAKLLLDADISADALFDVVRLQHQLDHPANRTLLAMLRAVRRRCEQTATGLRRISERETDSATRTLLRPRLDRRVSFLEALAGSVSRIARTKVYAAAGRAEVTAAGLNAVAAHPIYAHAYRQAWRALRPGVAGESESERLWISPTWEIYERWCYTRILVVLAGLLPRAEWERRYQGTHCDRICTTGRDGDLTVRVWLQPRFPAADAAGGEFCSISGELRPDIVIVLSSGGKRHFIVLDAKYRTHRSSVLDAMRSAHIYRDALRWEGMRPKCSLLLVPRGGGAVWLEDPAHQRAHGVGVLPLSLEENSAALAMAMRIWLDLPD